MGWIRIAGRFIEYTGKLAQADGFEEWATSVAKEQIEKWAELHGVKYFKNRRTRNTWWKELKVAGASGALRAAIEKEVQLYQLLPGKIAERNDRLPRRGVYHAVVAVPRFLVNVIAYDNAVQRLGNADELRRLSGGMMFAEYFLGELVRQMDTTLCSIRPTPRHPAPSGGNWLLIGFDRDYNWLEEPPGHHYVVETRSGELSRDDMQSAQQELSELATTLGYFSREEKEAQVRQILGVK